MLPESLRKGHQLVVTFDLPAGLAARVREYAAERGVAAELVVTGEVTDAVLRVLYQRCAAFVFPSLYEGFGLPILEALHCGAAVVAGNNSSQPEAAGDAAVLVDAADPAAIAGAMARVLSDHDLARSLRGKATRTGATLFLETDGGTRTGRAASRPRWPRHPDERSRRSSGPARGSLFSRPSRPSAPSRFRPRARPHRGAEADLHRRPLSSRRLSSPTRPGTSTAPSRPTADFSSVSHRTAIIAGSFTRWATRRTIGSYYPLLRATSGDHNPSRPGPCGILPRAGTCRVRGRADVQQPR